MGKYRLDTPGYVVVDSQGAPHFDTFNTNRAWAIKAFMADIGGKSDWAYWRKSGYHTRKAVLIVEPTPKGIHE